MTTVAVIGLGAMGSRMARRLLDHGHEVVVWNRTPARTSDLTEAGAIAVASPAEAARQAEAVITMVADPQALRDVTEGPEGVADGADASTTVIQMSTVHPEALERLRSALPSGVEVLDAPVLGSLSEAESGSLTIFAGGPAPVLERWEPMLSAMGSTLHAGPFGAGTAAKLVANSTLLGVLGVLGEALALGRKLGLPLDVTFDVLALTPLSAQAERRRPAVESGDAPVRFSLALGRKDAELIRDAVSAAGGRLRLGAAVLEWFAEAEEAGWGDRDYSAVLTYVLRSL